MTLWTSQDAAAATGGQTYEWAATGVSIDTRTLVPGDLFVALKDIRDGHDFVAQALDKGAAAALVSRVPSGVDPAKCLVVDDVLTGLERLGAAARARTGAKVIGITGSVGKTSTKEMLRAALELQGKTHAAEKSYNNHWGVPLTLARMPADSEFAIIEIGMNHPGEIAPLARLADLDVAVVTTVAAAHLAAFDGIDDIAREKAAIFQGLRPGGAAVLNTDIGTAQILKDAAIAAGAVLHPFGSCETAQHRAQHIAVHEGKTVIRARLGTQNVSYKINTPGVHSAMNALAVLGVVSALDADLALGVIGLSQWAPPPGRGTREQIILDPVQPELSIDLLDDAYNANPTSVAAALQVLAATGPRHNVGRIAKGRRIAILGDMLEIGKTEMTAHAALAEIPEMALVDLVHCVGPRMSALYAVLPENQRGIHVAQSSDLRISGLLDAGDVVLVKGSLGSKMAVIVDAIRKLGHPPPATND